MRTPFQDCPYKYFSLLFDEGECTEFDQNLRAADPLSFTDTKHYPDRVHDTIEKSGKTEAVRNAYGKCEGADLVVSAMDFGFIGGSMGSVVGEKIARAADRAIQLDAPLLVISQSGGARMMEGAFSLMQMLKPPHASPASARKSFPSSPS